MHIQTDKGKPYYRLKLSSLQNTSGIRISVNWMVVAHFGPHNLGNLLSYLVVDTHINPPV
eukprot:15187897-Ditylum_brightwellii.AAC.1